MRFDKRLVFASILLAVSVCPAGAQTVTNHAFAIGRGPGQSGYTSALCTSAQLAVGQAAADPICRTVTGDVTIDATGATAIGASKVQNAQLATMAANTTKCNAAGGTANPTDCTASTMRTNLALVPGTNVEAWDADLDALAALAGTGIARRTASNTWSVGTAVTNAELATMTANTIKGNATAGSATPTDLAVPSCSGANQAVNWTSGTGLGCVTISSGASPIVTTKTANYTIAVGDCGSRIEASGGPWTLTLPAVAGFSAGCQVQVCNTDPNDNTHHAIKLSGFPAPSMVRLWMGQCQTASVTAGTAWTISSFPGLFRPSFTPKLFIDTGGSDSNDGLVSNAAGNALRNVQACFDILQSEFDLSVAILGVGIPTCGPTGGQTFTAASLQYQKGGNGNGGVYLIGQGGVANLRTSGNVVLQMIDFAGYIISGNINYDCTSAGSHPCTSFFMHQQNILDISSASPANLPNTFTGGGAGDIGLQCDSQCKVNSSIAPTLAGTMTTGIQVDQGGVVSLNSGLTVAASATIGGNIFQFSKGSTLVWSGLLTLGATNSIAQVVAAFGSGTNIIFATFSQSGTLGGGGRQWAVLNNAFFCNGSATAIPGSAGINSAAGYTGGTVTATSGSCAP